MEYQEAFESLRAYLFDGADSSFAASIGAEVETQFVDQAGRPIKIGSSQFMMQRLAGRWGWKIVTQRGSLITVIASPMKEGTVSYELGRHNLEISSSPFPEKGALMAALRHMLEDLYWTGWPAGMRPAPCPVVETEEDLLVVPDERDATWLTLDGRPALNLLASTSAVQFTVEVDPSRAIHGLNALGRSIGMFLRDYPQESRWRRYIRESTAGYDGLRYGGPLVFADENAYVAELLRHRVVTPSGLASISELDRVDWPLFLRSVWWYFRLKRYGKKLCIEVRPLPRLRDNLLATQLDMVLSILSA